jgi:hypothetical protein
MNAVPKLILLSAVLALTGCGKNNQSGKSNSGIYNSSYCVSYGPNGQCSQYQNYSVSNFNSPYSFGGVSLNQVQMENPCILSGGGYYGQSTFNRQVVTTPVNIGTVVTQGDMYVGVTSFGDVAAIVGNGTATPTFVAYLCPRPISGQGTLYPQIKIGAYTDCAVKYITAANMVFPDGTQANFRALSPGGTSLKTKFSFCAR